MSDVCHANNWVSVLFVVILKIGTVEDACRF
jgi:hypothetical protein